MIPEDQNDVAADGRGFFRRDEEIEGRGDAIAAGAHLTADGDVKAADFAAVDLLRRRRQADVLRLRVRAVLFAAGDRDIEFSRQVGVGLVGDKHLGEFVHNRRRVEELIRGESGYRTADNIADVIHAGLESDEPHSFEPLPDLRHVLNREPAQLNLLARCDVGETFSELRADLTDGAQLCSRADSIRDANAHHEMAWGLLTEKNAGPLQPLAIAFGDRFPPLYGIARNLPKDIE